MQGVSDPAGMDQDKKFSLALMPNIPESPEQDRGTLPRLQYGIASEITLEDIPRRELSYHFYVTAQPVGSRTFQPSPWETESPTATADLERPDTRTLLSEIFGELDAAGRWREDWIEEKQQLEKPSEKALTNAKQVAEELYNVVVISGGHPLHAPVISYDYDDYITMVWRKGQHALYLEINEDEIQYVKVWGINIDSEMDAGMPSKENYLMLWEWLLNG